MLQTDTGMFLLSALQSRPDPSLREAIRKEVQQELEHSARLDRDAWLKLARTAPRDELVRALEEKMERYHALRDGVAPDDSLRTDIDVILGRASSALRLARQAPKTAIAEAVLKRHAAEAAAAVQQTPTQPPRPRAPAPLPAPGAPRAPGPPRAAAPATPQPKQPLTPAPEPPLELDIPIDIPSEDTHPPVRPAPPPCTRPRPRRSRRTRPAGPTTPCAPPPRARATSRAARRSSTC